jgi:hypothetical protein
MGGGRAHQALLLKQHGETKKGLAKNGYWCIEIALAFSA